MKNIYLIFLILLYSKSSFSIVSQNSIAIVASYGHKLSIKRGIIESLKAQIKSVNSLHTFYLDSKNTKEEVYIKKAKLVLSNLLNLKPSLVFLIDDNALKLLGPSLLEKEIKVVFLGINGNPRDYVKPELLQQASGVLEKPLFLRGIFELRAFFKTAKKVTILFDNSQTSHILIEQIFSGDKLVRRDGLEIDYKQLSSFEELKKYIIISNKDKSKQIFMGTLHSLKNELNKKPISIKKTFNWVSEHYQYPIFSFWQDTIGANECLAAYGVDIKEQGVVAGKIGNLILQKKNYLTEIVTPNRGLLFLSKYQLKKYKKLNISKNLKDAILLD